MPLLTVKQTPGQSIETKKELLAKLTETYIVVTGSNPASVWVTIEEVSLDDWSVGGRSLADHVAANQKT